MNVISQVIAVLTALALIGIGVLEIFFHADRRFHRLFLIEPADAPAVRMWAMNIGAYNIGQALFPGLVVVFWLLLD